LANLSVFILFSFSSCSLFVFSGADLWLSYIELEMKQGNFEKVNTLHWKATKTLKDTSRFLQEYNKLK
jgi:hypothetical protein